MTKKIRAESEVLSKIPKIEEGEEVYVYKERSRPKKKKKTKKENKRSSPIFSILVNIVLLYILNNKSFQNTPFITEKFNTCLPIINVFLSTKIIGSLLFFLNDSVRFRSSVGMFLNLLSLIAAYTLYKIFPFNLPKIGSFNGEVLVRMILFLAMIGTGVAVIIEFFKAVFNTDDWK